jgi:hypothetical protein
MHNDWDSTIFFGLLSTSLSAPEQVMLDYLDATVLKLYSTPWIYGGILTVPPFPLWTLHKSGRENTARIIIFAAFHPQNEA